MNTLTFIAALVHSLAWPIAAVLAVAICRKQLAGLADYVSRIKVGPFEMELNRLKAEVATALIEDAVPGTDEPTPLSRPGSLADVLVSYEQLFALLREGVELENETRVPTGRLVKVAVEQGVLTSSLAEAVRGLVDMRNLLVHSSQVSSPDDLLEFRVLIDATTTAIKDLAL